ncbi:uncharacterized protein FOMMEDRAFT_75974 [Fomitiporia mediterranea MF3/22]|uniref:uncharacterized protein n=1 Tax=Fomitiporia mediterranea (strain MF3/22) TaxID=694068 RepID=UPI0004409752|nr:uncharacterized protein FOMMEDRAFT_75974 [Fomitiporia mediterranea MF3/22]EJD07147.1 hypothetical protein FOMMEDRAFT_75974 [Fomitiporia mediterranea MF3/22]
MIDTLPFPMNNVVLLILGAGWSSDFLIPLLIQNNVEYAATTRDGRTRSGYETIKFDFDPDSEDPTSFQSLPDAQTVLITFPIYKSGVSRLLVKLWKETHPKSKSAFIQLGSTGIWNGDQTLRGTGRPIWCDRHSPFNTSNDRARAESELLALAPTTPTTVLDLSGLWGGQRSPRNWVRRVASSKEDLSRKRNIHLIHGIDVARAVLAVHQNFAAASGQRWLLTDCRVYDWWDLASAWGEGSTGTLSEVALSSPEVLGPQPGWVRELMAEAGIHALPRPPSSFDRALDSREFWDTFGLSPIKTLLSP